MIKRKQKQKKSIVKQLFLTGVFVALAFLTFYFVKFSLSWLDDSWDGQRQVTLAVEAKNKDILILSITPQKGIATIVVVPSNLEIETPWFGTYQAGKLSLLSQQENNPEIFKKSLAYFLGIPIDFGIMGTNFMLNQGEFAFKDQFLGLFFPPRSVKELQVWHFLGKRDLFWKTIYLPEFCQEKILPDNSTVLVLNHDRMIEIADYFIDPIIREEGLVISVFNLGSKDGLAAKAAVLIGNMGSTVVEVGNKDFNTDDECLILVPNKEVGYKATIIRIGSVLGCQIKQDRRLDSNSAQILLKNVKI